MVLGIPDTQKYFGFNLKISTNILASAQFDKVLKCLPFVARSHNFCKFLTKRRNIANGDKIPASGENI